MQQFFLGFTEDLIANFSKFSGLFVISHFSTSRIKDVSNRAELKALGADFFLFGSVRQTWDKLRISIQLLRADDQSVVFANHHDHGIEDLMEAQDEIIQQLVAVLREKIDNEILSHSYRKKSVELAAYENYLRGMQELKKGSAQSDIESRKYFEAALKHDPGFSLAYSGIALSYFNFWSCLLWDRWGENMQGAHRSALNALALDPNDYIALGILGRVYLYQGQYELSESYLNKSLQMNPNDTSNLLRVAFSFIFLNQTEKAVQIYERALELNPLHATYYYAYGSNFYLQKGEFQKSVDLAKKAPIDQWTDFPAWVAAAYLQLGDHDNVDKNWKIYLELYQKSIFKGQGDLEVQAIQWLKVLNPFIGGSYLDELEPYILGKESVKTDHFQHLGDHWEFSFGGKTNLIKDMKGLHDIQLLLQTPHQSHSSLDLMGAVVEESQGAVLIDKQAKNDYLGRIKELQLQIQEAESLQQQAFVENARMEYDQLLDHLGKSMAKGGQSRKKGATLDKSRSAVTWRIRSAIKKIEEKDPAFAQYLNKHIQTGNHCAYVPLEMRNWVF